MSFLPISLREIPAFEPLARVADYLGLDLIVFGSVASRASIMCAFGLNPDDLFELCEHTSDIDIAHTGSAAITPHVRSAIAAMHPFAPWFRWSIIDTSRTKVTLSDWHDAHGRKSPDVTPSLCKDAR